MAERRPNGLTCERCGSTRLHVIRTTLPCPGRRIRYRQCCGCGWRVKTIEVVANKVQGK